ncbi:DsbA family protein [Allomesorhizobium camelthorni]|uniref:DsbA family protein n=1 Tax=Allomesorhizobium camelthorni TaxID=475069 RepID=A0A6G4WDZ1_9HYPH|nr:DsbA family protein [Mesorhizobium camelthorni]NGO53002.1 DsbA family protein [Mesorhizobium camelthorni]
MSNKLKAGLIALSVLALLLLGLAALHYPVIIDWLRQSEHRRLLAAELRMLIPERRDALFNDPAAPTVGNPEGDVALVTFFDYNCPQCRGAALVVHQAVKDDPKLKIVFKEYPILGPDSKFAAAAALASRKQGKYEAFHLALMGSRGRLSESSILTIAGQVGIEVEQLKRDMDDPAIADALARNRALASDLHIFGTPALVVSDEVIPGLIDFPTLQRSIAQAREKSPRVD